MKLGTLKLIDKADIARLEEPPKWIDALLAPLNQFIEVTVRALQGRLTFEDNFQATRIELNFTSGTELKVNPKAGKLRVIGLIPVWADGKSITGHQHTLYQDGSVGVTLTYSGGGEAKARIYFLLG